MFNYFKLFTVRSTVIECFYTEDSCYTIYIVLYHISFFSFFNLIFGGGGGGGVEIFKLKNPKGFN